MHFQANLLLNSGVTPRSVDVQVGRFQVHFDLGQKIYDRLEWRITNAAEVIRAEDRFPASGKISQHNEPVEQILILLDQLASYDAFLAVEEQIEANPEKYRKIAEAEQKAEEKAKAEAEKAAAAAEQAAEKERLEAEEAAKAAAEAAAEEARKEEAARIEAKKQAKLQERIRAAAARELGDSQHV